MHILVTGSSGTIGTRLCEHLLDQGHKVTGVDWRVSEWSDRVQEHTINLDMRDDECVDVLVDKLAGDVPDAIVHFAANARVYELVEVPSRARDNFQTTFTALEVARKAGIKNFIFASSRELYGNRAEGDSASRSESTVDITECESPYAASKLGGEGLVRSYEQCYDIDFIIYRFSNVYGMYDNSDRFVPLFIRKIRNNESITVFGEDKVLDFTYIDDTVDGVMLGLEKFESVKGKTFNLGNGEGINLVDATKMICDKLGHDVEIKITESRAGEVMKYIADIKHAKEVLGYDPKYPFEQGLEKTIEWYNENNV